MKNYLYLTLAFTLLTGPTYAQMVEREECDHEIEDCRDSSVKEPNKTIYPYRPFQTSHIRERLSALTENNNFTWKIQDLAKVGNVRNTTVQPWGGSYWPLNQGMIGNTYQDKDYKFFIFSTEELVRWQKNVNDYKKRKEKVHPKILELDEKELAKLSPSEKYDLLLGDTSFDLTNRVWDFAEKWGNEKKWGFLSKIDLPDGFRIPTANKLMALWEGICHGWAVAAGHYERAENTVWVTLPNGKRMPFYPNDIKALVSLLWANSNIQGNVIFEGNRCNRKNPDRDKHGRYIDLEKDKNDTELLPRCADVHPGIFHVATVNILGIEGRSFVVDKSAEASVSNQPVSGYELVYFNPQTGKEGSLEASIVSRRDYSRKDPYDINRNPESTHIVGVSMKLKYIDWEFPRKAETNSAKDDKIGEMNFNYDLELNARGEVVGGQWRVSKKGNGRVFKNRTGQPDFFWVIPKDWKEYFRPSDNLPKWDFSLSQTPPSEYLPAAHVAHSFVYEESKKFFGTSPQCPVFPMKGVPGDMQMVDCEFRYPRPQPLIQVVDKLLELSRKME
jgi:hypothetical protein